MSSTNASTLSGCLTSLSTSNSLLQNSLQSLDTLTDDFGRLKLILDQNKIFTLIPEHDLTNAKNNLIFEIEPKIMKLLDTIKQKVSKLERKKSNYVSKIQLNEVRISGFKNDSRDGQRQEEVEGTTAELERLKELKLKKDRLKYKISSINLQNRKSRLSMVNR